MEFDGLLALATEATISLNQNQQPCNDVSNPENVSKNNIKRNKSDILVKTKSSCVGVIPTSLPHREESGENNNLPHNHKRGDFQKTERVNIEARGCTNRALGRGSLIQQHSGLIVQEPLISSCVLEARLSQHAIIKISDIRSRHYSAGLGTCWACLTAVGEVSPDRTSSSGQRYLIWKLTDLEQATISVFVFGEAYKSYCRDVKAGSMVALFNAKVRAEGNEFSLSIEKENQVVMLGRALHFAYCKAIQKNGNPCNVPVNSAKCQYCSYHVASEYKRIQTKRIELQGNALKTAFGGKNSLKWKPGHFISPENAQKPILGPVSKEEMKNLALKAAQASSKTGARYLRTVADPEGAKADAMVAEQARERSQQSTQNKALAPLPLPRVAAVVYQPASISRGCDSKVVKSLREKMVALEDSKVSNTHGDQNARKRALEILNHSKSLPSQTSIQKRQATPKFLEAAVHAKARNSQVPPHTNSPLLSPPNITRTQSAKVGVARNLKKAQSQPNATKSSFELAFGSVIVDMETEKGTEMMHHSKYQDLVEEDQEDQLGAYLDVLERKDALAAKMDSIKSLQVHAWRCHACQCVSEYKSKRCSESHPHALQKIQVTKRWWECVGCKKRFSTVGIKYPSRCPKCGVVSGEFSAVSMLRKAETRSSGLDQEKFASREGLLARGIEQKWVNQ